MSGELLTSKQLDIVRFCAEECDRQRSGELSVGWMIQAWMHAIMTDTYLGLFLELGFVKELGRLVEPEENKNGFRRHGVAISNGFLDYTPIGSNWDGIERNLQHLIEAYYDGSLASGPMHGRSKTPEDEFYYQYEIIHPFGDGNGRTGKILYNYLMGTLSQPLMPPDYFGTSNP